MEYELCQTRLDAGIMSTGANSRLSQSDNYREIGRELFGKGNYHAAVEVYIEALSSNPSDSRLLNNLSLCYGQMQKWPQARRYALSAFRIEPENAKWAFSLARALFYEGRMEAVLKVIAPFLECDDLASETLKELRKIKSMANTTLVYSKTGVYPVNDMVS